MFYNYAMVGTIMAGSLDTYVYFDKIFTFTFIAATCQLV